MVTSYKLPYQNMLIYKFLRSQIPTKLHLLPNQENYSATIIFLSSNIFFYLLLGDPGILVSRSQYLTMWILFNLSYLKSFLWKGTHHLVPSSNSSKRPLTDITPMVEQVFMTLQKWKSFHIAERGWHSFYPWKKKRSSSWRTWPHCPQPEYRIIKMSDTKESGENLRSNCVKKEKKC